LRPARSTFVSRLFRTAPLTEVNSPVPAPLCVHPAICPALMLACARIRVVPSSHRRRCCQLRRRNRRASKLTRPDDLPRFRGCPCCPVRPCCTVLPILPAVSPGPGPSALLLPHPVALPTRPPLDVRTVCVCRLRLPLPGARPVRSHRSVRERSVRWLATTRRLRGLVATCKRASTFERQSSPTLTGRQQGIARLLLVLVSTCFYSNLRYFFF